MKKFPSFIAAVLGIVSYANSSALTITDPIEGVQQDITSVTASYDAQNVYFSASFTASSFNPATLGLLFGLDTDLNINTGVPSTSSFPVGADYVFFYNALTLTNNNKFAIVKYPNSTPLALIAPVFSTDSVYLIVPRSILGNASVFRFGLASGVSGNSQGFLQTDFASQTLGGPSDFGTPAWASNVPEVSGFFMMAFGIIALTYRSTRMQA
jgi:hypothetical protein